MDPVRPRISVCMATYQGQQYVAIQLRSILDQLEDSDEVIVVDDHSTDRTCDEVRFIGDTRVHLIERDTNQGVARTFEQALSYCSGEVVFLSDQDDIWAAGKVTRVMREFQSNPDVGVVVTDAAVIDENGRTLGMSYYARRGNFRSDFLSNLLRCKFLGCTMAFRSRLLPRVIPFPRYSDVLHDVWIGVINSVTKGNTLYINEPFVWYRRHSSTVTGKEQTLMLQLRRRWHLVKAVGNFCLQNRLDRRFGI
jgi:glycosyltransferase involved in cell wall biosynthesis